MPSPAHKIGVLLATLAALLLVSPASAQTVVPASAPGNVVCTDGPTFDLTATDGRIQTPDGNTIYMWGYAAGGGSFQIPGPVLCVTEGDTVTVNLTNELAEPTSIVFPGQSGVTATGGSPGLLAREAAASGGVVSYSFTAGRPGTYLYESGSEPSKQVEMGLYGALIVRPALGPNFAYNDPSTQFDPEREYILVLHEIDPELHRAVERGQPFDITKKHDRYWTINGRSFPDTIADNGVSWLPSQPFGSLVWVEPFEPVDNPLPALIRYANAGLSNHPFHPHGNHLRVLARDGALLQGPTGQDASMEAFTKTIGSGQTYDLLFRFDDDEGYSPVSPVQFEGADVVFPGVLNLVFKDDLSFYSGSPYLGEQDDLPPSTTVLNECGEFYFPWHSHALNEFQNFDEGFGGLATLLRVDPPGGCPTTVEGPFNIAPPVVSGTGIQEQTLAGTDGTWTGTPPITFTRQWQRLVGVAWVDISSATGPTYTLTEADVDTQVRVCVMGTNSFGTATACSDPFGPVAATLRLSFTAGGTIGGVGFADEDIVSFSGVSPTVSGSVFTLLFDGSDVGVGGTADVSAFAFIDEDSILFSFNTPVTVPGVGSVDDSDVVRFDATSLGPTTAGSFSMYFDGSDVGLTTDAEDVDVIQLLDDGTLILSTIGSPDVPGVTGDANEDLLRFTPTSLGDTTAGTWTMYFDGSDVGLAAASENVDAAWVAGNGAIHLSTSGAFAVPGVSGADEDVFLFMPTSLGTTTAGTFSPTLQFDGSVFGQGANNVDGAGRRGATSVGAASLAAASSPKISAAANLRGRTLTVTARTRQCSPCAVSVKVKAPGQRLRSLTMRRIGSRYVAVAANLPRGRIAYYTQARDVDSRRAARSPVRQVRIGAAALVTFDLCADEGTTTLPGAGPVPIWGFSQDTGSGCGPAQLPGPQLVVNEGDVVTINLTNNLDSESTSLVFPGQTLAPDTAGASPGGGTTSYTFTAAKPGIYLYETGVNTQIQLPMGLYGALIVRPALGANFAYNDLSTAFDVEAVMVLSEVDTDLNAAPGSFDPLDWDPDYRLINGMSYPDIPAISAAPNARVALRYLNAGQEHDTMTLVGLRQRIVARDSFQPVARPDVVAETIAVGSTADAIATVPGGSSGATFPLYNRQLALTNGSVFPGGMLTFVAVP